MTPHQPHRGELPRKFADENEEFADMFQRYRDGGITEAQLKQSYVEAMDTIEPYVESLLDELEGKSIITAEHGERWDEKLFGLQRLGHGHETTECRFIPWLELPYDEPKDVQSDEPVGINYADQSVINDRLEDLGIYKSVLEPQSGPQRHRRPAQHRPDYNRMRHLSSGATPNTYSNFSRTNASIAETSAIRSDPSGRQVTLA